MITYEQFLADTEVEDIRVLNLLSQGQRIQFNDLAQATAMGERVARLEDAGLVLRWTHSRERVDGAIWHGFDGLVDPVAAAYLARAASERVVLSRNPLPA
ncbi:hypothetical protein ACHZ97_04330 [Lysobacter soli]|uniref:hypothetical protein n=1 Tax=Lysobacter soli TaxID=453783 RepID=UPI0037C89ECC